MWLVSFIATLRKSRDVPFWSFNFLHGLAFVVFFVLRTIWCCYPVITMKHPSCGYKLQSLAPIQDMLQLSSQYMCYRVNRCLGLLCYYLAALENNNNPVFVCFYVSCLLYQHLPLGRFSCVLGSKAMYFRHDGEYRRIPVRQPAPDQPVMTYISGREVRFLLLIAVPSALLAINLLH